MSTSRLLRLNADGANDTSFGTNGLVLTPVPNLPANFDAMADLALQPDGKIVAVGSNLEYTIQSSQYVNQHSDVVLARYDADGSLDAGFGTGGLVAINPPVDEDFGYAVALRPGHGQIVVAGEAARPLTFQGRLLIQRYNPDGSLDAGYGTDGETTTAFIGERNDTDPVKPLVLPDGKIVVAGSTSLQRYPEGSTFPGGTDFGLAEYNPDGTLNTGFGRGGRVITSFGFSPDLNDVTGMALEFVHGVPKIVVEGTAVSPGSPGSVLDIALARYNLDGTLDTSFGNGGEATFNLGATGSELQSQFIVGSAGGVAVQADGKIVVACGLSEETAGQSYADFGVIRVDTDGSLDTSFGDGGVVETDMSPPGSPGSVGAYASSVVIQPDGKIVVGGGANFNEEFCFLRDTSRTASSTRRSAPAVRSS